MAVDPNSITYKCLQVWEKVNHTGRPLDEAIAEVFGEPVNPWLIQRVRAHLEISDKILGRGKQTYV